MALTESKLKDLHDKKFDKLFEAHTDEWTAITANAFKSARDHICEGRAPRHDDVLKMLARCLSPMNGYENTKKKIVLDSSTSAKPSPNT